jgi:hypothetical protein
MKCGAPELEGLSPPAEQVAASRTKRALDPFGERPLDPDDYERATRGISLQAVIDDGL